MCWLRDRVRVCAPGGNRARCWGCGGVGVCHHGGQPPGAMLQHRNLSFSSFHCPPKVSAARHVPGRDFRTAANVLLRARARCQQIFTSTFNMRTKSQGTTPSLQRAGRWGRSSPPSSSEGLALKGCHQAAALRTAAGARDAALV